MTAQDHEAPKNSQTPTKERTDESLKNFFNSTLNSQIDVASDITASTRFHIQKAGATVWATITKPVSGVIQVIRDANSDKGTLLRKVITDMRLKANDKINFVKTASKESEKSISNALFPVTEKLAWAKKKGLKFNEFRKNHPSMVVFGVAFLFGIPTLLRHGKFRGTMSGLATASVTAGAMYGVDKLEKHQQSRGN